MDEDEQFMALLGGVRDTAGTVAYLEMNVKHWAEHGFGMWMLRDAETSAVIGRAILRHLDVEGVDEVEVGYGFMPGILGPRSCHRNRAGLRAHRLRAGWPCRHWSRSRRQPTSLPNA